MLDGSRSVFPTEGDDATIAKRIAALDIHPTGPLCGRGIPRTTRLAFQTEESILSDLTELGGERLKRPVLGLSVGR